MNSEFYKQLVESFKYYEFKIIKNNSNNMPIGFIKNESPVLYIVNIIDPETTNIEGFNTFLNNIVNTIETALPHYYCNNAICLNIIINGTLESFNKDIYSEKVHFAYWYIDTDKKSITVPKGNADKILNINQIINNALFGNNQNYKQLSVKASKPILTSTIILINFIIWIIMILFQSKNNFIYSLGNNRTLVFEEHQYYRLFTSMFIHFDALHILYNMFSMYLFGFKCEKYFGRIKTLFIYVFSGLFASVISCIFTNSFSIGASGAVYGILGAILALSNRNKKSIDGISYFTLLLIILAGITVGSAAANVDNYAHIGGFIGGFIFGLILSKKEYN